MDRSRLTNFLIFSNSQNTPSQWPLLVDLDGFRTENHLCAL
jgi:hypothetical protein